MDKSSKCNNGGLKVVIVKCDDHGNIDFKDLVKKLMKLVIDYHH